MKCHYCGLEMTAIEGIKGMHYKCSDLAIGEWAGLKEEKNKLEEFHNQVCAVHFTKVLEMETETERLKLMVRSITGGLDEAIESNQYLEKELDKAGQERGQLRDALAITQKALELACKSLEDTQKTWLTPGGWSLEHTFLKQAEREVERSVDCGI